MKKEINSSRKEFTLTVEKTDVETEKLDSLKIRNRNLEEKLISL